MFSDEYKKMIENMNRISQSVPVKLQNMFQENLQLRSILSQDISTELSNRLTEIKSQMKDFSRVSEQLSEVIPSFQLSEEVREFIQEAKESESYLRKNSKKDMVKNSKYARFWAVMAGLFLDIAIQDI